MDLEGEYERTLDYQEKLGFHVIAAFHHILVLYKYTCDDIPSHNSPGILMTLDDRSVFAI